MSRGAEAGYDLTTAYSTAFDASNDGPCTTARVRNPSTAEVNVIAKITGKDGLVTIDVLEPGTSSEYRIGINHIAKIELKCESGTSTAYACPAAWGAEKI